VPLKQQPAVLAAGQRRAAAACVAGADRARQRFHRDDRLRLPKACERLARDWARMRTDSPRPKEPWRPVRTTNVVASPVAAVRLRPSAAKRCQQVERATVIIWHLLPVAEKRFRTLDAPEQCRDGYRAVRYADGSDVPVVSFTQKAAA
jgi:transposase-like protein